MQQVSNIIILIQIPIIISIFLIGLQAEKIHKEAEFRYVNRAWAINLAYIVLKFVTRKMDMTLYEEKMIETFFDLLSTFFFLLAVMPYLKEKNIWKFRKASKLAIIAVFIGAGIFRTLPDGLVPDILKGVEERNIPVAILDGFVLYFLALFFRQLSQAMFQKLNGEQGFAKFLYLGTLLYALIQPLMIADTQVSSNVFYENAGFLLGLVAKILILVGLAHLLLRSVKEIAEVDKELTLRKAFGDKLNQILGRTFHEITPPLLEVETVTLELMPPEEEKAQEIGLSKKAKRQVEKIESAVHRMRTILTASMRMYTSDSTIADHQEDTFELPMPIDEEQDVHNVNTLIQIAIMNFKTVVIKDFRDNFVSDRLKVITEYGGNCNITCNSVEMVQIFYNLLKNSYEACEGAATACHVFVKTKNVAAIIGDKESKERKCILIEFEDNGPGIPATLTDKIFEQGFSTKTDNSGRGRGYGLNIVRSYTHDNYGEISIESPVENSRFLHFNNPGSKFRLLFPRTL